MTGGATNWNGLVERGGAVQFIDINLRGVGQVFFQNNPLTGLLFLAAIVWSAYAAKTPAIAVGAVVGLVVSTTTAILLRSDATSLRQGLFGFNGVLVGVAVPTFLAPVPAMWPLLVLGAAVSTVVMLAVSKVMKSWGTPALTFPFVLTTWFLILSAHSFGRLPIDGIAPPHLPQAVEAFPIVDFNAALLGVSWIKGVAQVFLIDNWVAGLLILLGLVVSSVWAAVFALLGSAAGLAGAVLLGAAVSDIDAGLYGFSPALTAIALGCVFYQLSWRVALFALLGAVFTVIVQGALDAALAPVGIPTFTAPFVFVTWLFLLPRADFEPHRHEPIERALLKDK
jgi:urea transporter